MLILCGRSLIVADGKLIIQAGASGNLIVVAVDPTGYWELRQMQVFDDKPETYTAPVLANGRIYCRSDEGAVVCLDVEPDKVQD